MPKTKISEFSATPANNTDIDSINIAEGCAPSGINDAIRELMAQLKDFQVGSAGDPVTVGGVLTVTAGAVGTPAITTAGDTNTGIFFPAADTIAFAEGGAEAMRIDASGRLIVGATSAAEGSPVEIVSNTSGGSIRIRGRASDGSGAVTFGTNATSTEYARVASDSSSALLFGTGSSGTERARIDSSGNLGLGVTPSAWASFSAIQIAETGCVASNAFSATNTQTYLGNNAYYNAGGFRYIYTGSAAAIYNITANEHKWNSAAIGTAGDVIAFTNTMTLDSSGNLLVGTTSTTQSHKIVARVASAWNTQFYSEFSTAANNYGLQVYYSAAAPNNGSSDFLNCQDNSGAKAAIKSNGGIYNFSANNVNLSDRREKTNFAPASDYLAKICAIPVQTFNYIDQNMEDDGGLTLGVVAQDVQAVAPELVMESNWADKEQEPKMRLSIYQTDLQYALMKCIQEQQAIIESLKARLDAANL